MLTVGGLPKLAFRLCVAALLVDPRSGYHFPLRNPCKKQSSALANMICPADAFSFYLNYFLLHKKWACSLLLAASALRRHFVASLLVDPLPGTSFLPGNDASPVKIKRISFENRIFTCFFLFSPFHFFAVQKNGDAHCWRVAETCVPALRRYAPCRSPFRVPVFCREMTHHR